jgi:8-oxo-dGTP pyrophosphatase MutT (NUDIX family)
MQLQTAGLLLLKNRKLLLAYSNNKQCFYLPGGKTDTEETPIQALCREIKEELAIEITEQELTYYTHITAPAYGENPELIMEQECFLLTREVEPIASAEIGELRYFTLQEYLSEPRKAPGAIMILQKLKTDNYID